MLDQILPIRQLKCDTVDTTPKLLNVDAQDSFCWPVEAVKWSCKVELRSKSSSSNPEKSGSGMRSAISKKSCTGSATWS